LRANRALRRSHGTLRADVRMVCSGSHQRAAFDGMLRDSYWHFSLMQEDFRAQRDY
jgi:hypothetical protein